MTARVLAATAGILLASSSSTRAQQTTTAVTNVTLVRMDREVVEPRQTVLVRGDRVAAIGPTDELAVPPEAQVIDGTGRFLLPGLCDAHVHITTDMPWAPARPEFGDAPLYLAHGVTTVVNLRGTPTQLDWKARIERGDLLGPTIYTAGEFVNEPRLTTAADVRREVTAQARDGYDLIKFHEIWNPGGGPSTRSGLSRDAYLAMFESARQAKLPVVGHVPVHLGLDGLLASSGGAVAHIGDLSRLHFVLGVRTLAVTAFMAAVLALVVMSWAASALLGRFWRRNHESPRAPNRARVLFGVVLILVIPLFLGGSVLGPGGAFHTNSALRLSTALAGLAVLVVVPIAIRTALATLRSRSLPGRALIVLVIAAVSSAALAVMVALVWLPFLWRNSQPGIDRLAVRLRDAGIAVQSTLVVYDVVDAAGARRVVADPVFGSLPPGARSAWRQVAERRQSHTTDGARLPPRLPEFLRGLSLTFQRHGVQVLAGTDAMGVPLVMPGHSLIRELELLNQSGLTPYETIRTATINPARFLGREDEFGRIAVASRADFLLLRRNPLESVTALREIEGVMVRGTWLSRPRLQALLSLLQ